MKTSVYYNEIDPFAAEWMRWLIKAGEIPDGMIDTRSIVDVQPEDIRDFDQCHFFAGIGGWPYCGLLARRSLEPRKSKAASASSAGSETPSTPPSPPSSSDSQCDGSTGSDDD